MLRPSRYFLALQIEIRFVLFSLTGMSVPAEYRDMLRVAMKEEREKEKNRRISSASPSAEPPIKRRRRVAKEETKGKINEDTTDKVTVKSEQKAKKSPVKSTNIDRMQKIREALERNKKEQERDVIELSSGSEEPEQQPQPLQQQTEEPDEFDDFESDDFEDVEDEIEQRPLQDLTVKITKAVKPRKRKARPTVISSEERFLRRDIHVYHLFVMVSHGVVRNKWINNETLMQKLRDELPNSLKREYLEYEKCKKLATSSIGTRTRKLLDLLRHLMNYWISIWSNDPKLPILFKHTWSEINQYPNESHKVRQNDFISTILKHNGSRDMSAQGFCSLLRSLGLPARLVFSLQPPDFTNMIECEVFDKRQMENSEPAPPKAKKVSQRDRILEAFKPNKKRLLTKTDDFEPTINKSSNWPVFWVEVWNKDAKKYITIDPSVKQTIEIVVNKSKLEPPMNCLKNNAWYVIGFDRLGGVRDITRRYAKEFNAKVRKKRIDREAKYQEWYQKLLLGACSSQRKNPNRVDKFEELDFEEFNEREGMPSSIADFKSHPIFVLENDLKWNEILEPMVSCGTVRKKTKNGKDSDLLPVYKRSNVVSLRTAKGWYMKGRILKVGERPLKIYKTKGALKRLEADDDDEDEDGEKRLYAERQTEKYQPPPVVNGEIPKNAYKNIDVYEPWMVPEGCVHIAIKEAEKACKLMRIEYAPAVVGFDFEGNKRRDVKAKIVGVVTLAEYQEAVELVCENLKEQKEDEDHRREELLVLRAWKIFLTKLQIKNRLIEEHGEVVSSEEEDIDVDSDGEGDSLINEDGPANSEEEEEEIDYDEMYAGFLPSGRTRSRAHHEENLDIPESDLEVSDFDEDFGHKSTSSKSLTGLTGEDDEELDYNPDEEGGLEDEFDEFMNN